MSESPWLAHQKPQWCPSDRGMHSCEREAGHDGQHWCACEAGIMPWADDPID